jgi:hypothetical protein
VKKKKKKKNRKEETKEKKNFKCYNNLQKGKEGVIKV